MAMKRFWTDFWKDDGGQDLVEYALAAGLVAVAAVAAMPTLSTTVSTVFSKIGSMIETTVT
jgi:pilus assembly protein Flp/PilA